MAKWIKTNTSKLINLSDFSIFWLEENKCQDDGFFFAIFGESKETTHIVSVFKTQGEALDLLDQIYMELLTNETKSP